MKDFKLIDYCYSRNGCPCNAVVYDMDGKVEANWTLDRDGEAMTEVHPVANEAFGLLWERIATSVSGGGVFWTHLVTDPTRLIDPAVHHVISAVNVRDGRLWHRTFMVPAGEADPVFTGWLEALAVLRGLRRGARESDMDHPRIGCRAPRSPGPT